MLNYFKKLLIKALTTERSQNKPNTSFFEASKTLNVSLIKMILNL